MCIQAESKAGEKLSSSNFCYSKNDVSDCLYRTDPQHTSNNHQQSLCIWNEVHHDGSSESNVWTPGIISIKYARCNKTRVQILLKYCIFCCHASTRSRM